MSWADIPLSTPRGTPQVGPSRAKTKKAATKRRWYCNENEIRTQSSTKRCLIPSTSSSSASQLEHDGIGRWDDEIADCNYGSEEESDDDEEGEELACPALMPRSARMFMQEDDYEGQLQTHNIDLRYEWPPKPEPKPHPELTLLAGNLKQEPDLVTPSYKFDFQWSGFPRSQIQPELRREIFSNTNVGPTVPLASPYTAFTAIWDHDFMEHIAVETNRYARQLAMTMLMNGSMCPNSRIAKWQDTDADELYVYFAVVMATGIVFKSQLEEYWNITKDIFSTPGFTVAMTHDRFLLLGRCLHFSDNDGCRPELLSPTAAKLYKIQPVVEHLNLSFSRLYNLSQNVALDESLTMWKGWLDINPFGHNKPATAGLKTYEVCDSRSGYLWRFELHAGHDEYAADACPANPISDVIPSLVLRLLNGLEHKGHTVWMDSYYHSPALARELKTLGFDCVGTLRTSRQNVPLEIRKLKKDEMAVGQVSGCTSGDVDILVWRDRNRVALISTYHGLAAVRCGDTCKPSIVPDYNINMGGVDRKDRMISMYPIERRTKVWYKKLFRRLLNVSVLNAYILNRAEQPITHRNFRKTLVEQLLAYHGPPETVQRPATIQCFPAQFNKYPGKKQERVRRFCALCRKRTNSFCISCDVPLCVFSCFGPYHNTGETL